MISGAKKDRSARSPLWFFLCLSLFCFSQCAPQEQAKAVADQPQTEQKRVHSSTPSPETESPEPALETSAVYEDRTSKQETTVAKSQDRSKRGSAPLPAGVTVTLDPGHGTKHSRVGAKNEAFYAMQVARLLKEKLEQAGIAVVLTHQRADRTEDLGANPDEDNKNRALIANRHGSVLYFRIHADSPGGPAVIYYPEKHPDREVARMSRLAAQTVWAQMLPLIKTIGVKYKVTVLTDAATYVGSRQGGLLTGSKHATVPTILVEMLPLNATGTRWIQKTENQHRMAEAMAQGILSYVRSAR